MFTNKEKNINRICTLIGEECTVNGSLKGTGVLKLDGNLEGDIYWPDDVLIGASSFCKGNITCKSAYVNGMIKGNVICEDILIIEENGKLSGDITVKRVIIKDGGILDGKCTMLVEQKIDEVMK